MSDPRHAPPDVRFWAKVNKDGPIPENRPELGSCWLWTASLDPHGYGQFWSGKRLMRAHRWAYINANGEPPPGTEQDHLCRVPACVRPSHQEPVPHRVNNLRGISPTAGNARKEECPKGHTYSFNRDGTRRCDECRLEWQRGRGHGPTPPKTHCNHGHEMTPQNTKIYQNARRCWICWRESRRRSATLRKEKD